VRAISVPLRNIQQALGKNPTVASVIDLYLPHAERTQKPLTYRDKLSVLSAFKGHIGHKRLSDCIPYDLERWVEDHAAWTSGWTLKFQTVRIQACFNWAVRSKVIRDNPFRGVHFRQGKPRRPVTDPEYHAMLRWGLDVPMKVVCVFMRLTGCRPQELRELEWADLDLENGVITRREHKTESTSDDGAPREIVLEERAWYLLLWLRRLAPAGQSHVFVNADGNPWKHYTLCNRIWRLRERMRRAGVPVKNGLCLAAYRHLYCGAGLRRGVSMKAMAYLLGHNSTRMVEHYSRIYGMDVEFLRSSARRAVRTDPRARIQKAQQRAQQHLRCCARPADQQLRFPFAG
jgi:integrase